MKIFKAAQVRQADAYTIAHEPILSVDLMERAANACVSEICLLYDTDKPFVIFAGPGNNGGDGLAIARLLADRNYDVQVYIVKFTDNFSADFKINLKRLKNQNKCSIGYITNGYEFSQVTEEHVLTDALFGSGLTRPLQGLPKDIVLKMNALPNDIVSVDIPSGLYGERNHTQEQVIVEAKYTLTFEFPFLSFFFPENERFVGQIKLVPIGLHPDYIKQTKSDFYLTEAACLKKKIKRRAKYAHKGTFGHAFIFAGSYGKAGAGVLACRAAHRAGAGLVTAAVPKKNYGILQITSPETMLFIDKSKKKLTQLPDLNRCNALAIGPAIGFARKTKQLLFDIISAYRKPIVFDADALTILSEDKKYLKNIPENSILTPHPKEFERLVGKWKTDFERLELQINFAKQYRCIVILKGAYTSVSFPNGEVHFNPTGNPGMATGGSGDVLTGIIVGLLAQNYGPEDASLLGVYLHGLAGDSASEKETEESLIASDIIRNLSNAFSVLNN